MPWVSISSAATAALRPRSSAGAAMAPAERTSTRRPRERFVTEAHWRPPWSLGRFGGIPHQTTEKALAPYSGSLSGWLKRSQRACVKTDSPMGYDIVVPQQHAVEALAAATKLLSGF